MFDSLSPEQTALRQQFVEVGEALSPLLAAAPRGEMPHAAWRLLAETGLFGFPVPVSAGGSARGPLDTVIAFEGLGLGCADLGFLFAANAHVWGAVLPLALHGNDAQIARWLPPLLDGRRVGAHGVTEHGTGSDVRAMSTRFDAQGDGIVLGGEKAYITCAPRAETFLIYARDGRVEGERAELGAVVLERADGVTTAEQPKLGLHGAPMGTVQLPDLALPRDRIVGSAGSGMAMFTTALEWERACVFGPFVGAMERQLTRCVRHARRRRQFGRPIGKFQAVSHRLADMKTRLDVSRMMLYRAATAKGAGRAPVEAAQAKLTIAEAFLQSSIDAVRIAGGSGYLEDAAAAEELRDAMGGPLFSGTSDIQKNIIAGFLGV
ncbi:MAG: acyl-CoA dehydrogenase family protein [Deltaproteobacteria bacterium]|nr:acyl-CoA dehydrogenase family protein [Deltaproteobacteria bacterium]